MANKLESDSSQAGNPTSVKGKVLQSASSFNRPADTTAYASGDLVANSTIGGSVAPMQFDVGVSQGIIRAALFKTSNASQASGASFRLHLFSQSPVPTAGDNAQVFAANNALVPADGHLGYIDMTVDAWGSNGALGRGQASPDVHFDLGSGTRLYGLLEARGAITPASAATITCTVTGLAA